MDIIRANQRPTRRGDPAYFTGTVWQDPIVTAPAPARVNALIVRFDPGSRTAWHTHPLGQTLHVISGIGRIQRAGERVQEILPGDSVWIEPGVKHWHGAAPDHAMVHLAIQEGLDGRAVDWMEPVSAQDYARSPEPALR